MENEPHKQTKHNGNLRIGLTSRSDWLVLSTEGFAVFETALDQATGPGEKLKSLLARKPAWEE